ncbi:MAG: FUSC family protein [Cumulibacter sp.]
MDFLLHRAPPHGPDDAPDAEFHNQAASVMGIMAGAVVVMVSTFAGPMFATIGKGVLGLSVLPVSMFGGIALGLAIADIQPLALTVMAMILGATGFLRRFGSWGFVIGQGLFMGNFMGLFLGHLTDVQHLGWVAIQVAIGGVVAILAQLLLFVPSRWSAIKRLRASFLGRADGVAAATIEVLNRRGVAKLRKRQHEQLVRLNETALIIDGQLAGYPRSPLGTTAAELHEQLFTAELSLANAARFARALSTTDAPDSAIGHMRDAMLAIRARNTVRIATVGRGLRTWLKDTDVQLDESERVILHRFATSVIDYATVLAKVSGQRFEPYPHRLRARRVAEEDKFEASVELASGWLPGSSGVSATASEEPAAQAHTAVLPPYVRAGIQMTIAAGISVVLGVLISPDRFYWAVIATFVTFMGANNAAEQVRKGVFRVIGTVGGVVIGALLAHAVGHHVAMSIVVILAFLFLGIYFMRVNYALFAVAITVMVSMLYVQLGEYSEDILELRLLETLVGSLAAVVTVLFVFPLRTARVVRIATREFVNALAEMVSQTILMLQRSEDEQELRRATRDLDAAFQALAAATAPGRSKLRIPGSFGGVEQPWWFATKAAHSYARNLVIDTREGRPIDGVHAELLSAAGDLLVASAAELSAGMTEHRTTRIYTRSASQFERVATGLDDEHRFTPRQLALRDLQVLDGALADLAQSAGLEVRSVDAAVA